MIGMWMLIAVGWAVYLVAAATQQMYLHGVAILAWTAALIAALIEWRRGA